MPSSAGPRTHEGRRADGLAEDVGALQVGGREEGGRRRRVWDAGRRLWGLAGHPCGVVSRAGWPLPSTQLQPTHLVEELRLPEVGDLDEAGAAQQHIVRLHVCTPGMRQHSRKRRGQCPSEASKAQPACRLQLPGQGDEAAAADSKLQRTPVDDVLRVQRRQARHHLAKVVLGQGLAHHLVGLQGGQGRAGQGREGGCLSRAPWAGRWLPARVCGARPQAASQPTAVCPPRSPWPAAPPRRTPGPAPACSCAR